MRSSMDVPIKPAYPTRPNRYFSVGWNANHQDCYTPDDSVLMQQVKAEFTKLGEIADKPYFDTTEEKHWYDWWKCIRPAYDGMLRKYDKQSFTLPNREAKDTKVYPLWDYADRIARQIANWQSERARDQNIALMNDPVMLIFEELRDWYFYVLATKECKPEDLHYLTRRQSYLKNLIHLIPDFGKDRLHLQELQQSLENAYKLVVGNIANRELPKLLASVVSDAKGLEYTIGAYLHFLLPNEKVDDNFSMECLEKGTQGCNASPVRKIYLAAQSTSLAETPSDTLAKFQAQHTLYQLSTTAENNGVMQVLPKLRVEAANAVRFATFVSADDKKNYVEALAVLEALKNVRIAHENFRNLLSSVGTYFFAFNYLEKANKLSANYISLVARANILVSKLIQTADRGMKNILTDPYKYKKPNKHFEENLRILDTRLVPGTTLKDQLENYSKKAVASMNQYSNKMDELVSDIHSGKASKEIERAMQELFTQVNDLNAMLTAVLDNKELLIDTHHPLELLPSQTDATSTDEDPLHNISGFELSPQTKIYTEWDTKTKPHPVTKIPVYTYRIFKDGVEIGSADYYGQASLCISSDGTQHNILRRTGILSELPEPALASIKEICKAPFPSLFEQVSVSATQSAKYGVIRGVSNVFGNAMQSAGYSNTAAHYASQIAYYSAYFSTRCYTHAVNAQEEETSTATLNAMYIAAIETGQMWLATNIFNQLGNVLQHAGEKLEKISWYAGNGLKTLGSVARYGMFALNAVETGLIESSVALASGAIAEQATEQTGNYFIKKLKSSGEPRQITPVANSVASEDIPNERRTVRHRKPVGT